MGAEELNFAATTIKTAEGTDGINDWMEINTNPLIEVFRVTSNETGDYIFCRKINRVKGAWIQNHGATYATGIARDTPKLAITQGSATSNAKITITHTTTREVFTLIVVGEQ